MKEKTVNQPSFSFQVEEHLESLNNSSIDTTMSRHNSYKSVSFSEQGLQRQLSWQSHVSMANTRAIHFSIAQDITSIAFLSELSTRFTLHIKSLVQSRDIFCSTEYPTSFTGEEAVVRKKNRKK